MNQYWSFQVPIPIAINYQTNFKTFWILSHNYLLTLIKTKKAFLPAFRIYFTYENTLPQENGKHLLLRLILSIHNNYLNSFHEITILLVNWEHCHRTILIPDQFPPFSKFKLLFLSSTKSAKYLLKKVPNIRLVWKRLYISKKRDRNVEINLETSWTSTSYRVSYYQ